MKKKLVSMVLTLAMAATLLAGCGSSDSGAATSADSSSDSSAATTTTTDSGASADTASSGEKTKLTAVFIAHPLTTDLENMKWLAEIEDEAGVEIEWEVIRADWDTTKPTRFAAGDVPDLLFNATSDSDYVTYNGLFVDLTQYLTADLAPNINAMFTEEPDTKVLATTPEGKIYGIPKFQGKWPTTNTVFFINKVWLDNLGLDVPTTFSEYKAVLEAFRDQDANGNGDPSDEIPLDFNGDYNGAYGLFNLIGGLGIQLTNWGTDCYFAEDGQVKNYAIDDRYKLFLHYINDLYTEGLINPNALTNDYSAFQSLSRGNEAGEAVVGSTFGWEETDKFGPELYSQYVPIPALDYDIDCAAGTYDTRWRDDYTGLNMSGNRVCVSAKCANVEAAVRFIDKFYDAEKSVQVLFGGISDGNVSATGDNAYKVNDPQDPAVDAGTWKWTYAFADNGPMYIRRATTIEMAQDMTFALKEREAYNDTIAKATEKDTYPQMFMKYTEEETATMAVNQANINNIVSNQWSLYMTGEQDIDSTWDAYVESVKAAGLDEVLAIRQKAFDAYLGK